MEYIILEFILIVVLQAIGIGLHVMQKIIGLDNKFPEMTRQEIIDTFFENDIFTLYVSALVLCLNLVVHLIVHVYSPSLIESIPYYLLWSFGVAFVLGYAGQRLVYKFLGAAESVINKKIENKQQ